MYEKGTHEETNIREEVHIIAILCQRGLKPPATPRSLVRSPGSKHPRLERRRWGVLMSVREYSHTSGMFVRFYAFVDTTLQRDGVRFSWRNLIVSGRALYRTLRFLSGVTQPCVVLFSDAVVTFNRLIIASRLERIL